MKISLRFLTLMAIVYLTQILPIAAQDTIPVIDLDQKELQPVWEKDFPYKTSDIAWNMVSSSGTLILSVKKSIADQAPVKTIMGYDQNSGNILFSFTADSDKSYSPESFEEIPNTPLIVLANTQKKQDQIVINTLTGNVVAESVKADMTRVYNRFVLMHSEKILFVGRKGMKSVVAMFDMATGEFWRQEKMFRYKMVEERINSSIVEFDDKSFLISTEGGLYCVSSETGETIWRAGIPAYTAPTQTGSNSKSTENVEDIPLPPARIYKHPDKPIAYYLSHMGLMAYNINTGEKKWKKFKKGDGEYTFVPSFNHLIVLGSRTNGYHYETGEPLWEKPAKIKGNISHMRIHGKHLIFVSESLNQISKNYTYNINAIDLETGLLAHKKDMDVNGAISSFLPCESGVLYLTDKEVNIYDLSTGAEVFKDPVTVRKGSAVTDRLKDMGNIGYGSDRLMMTVYENHVYFYNTKDNKLYSIDLSNNTIKPLLSSPLPFGNKEEMITSIEMRKNNIFLQSDHNIYLISTTGTLLYHTYYPPIEGLAYFAFSIANIGLSMAGEIAADEFNKEMDRQYEKAKAEYIAEGKDLEDMMKRADAVRDIKSGANATSQKYEETSLYKSIRDRKSLITEGNNLAIIHGRIKQNNPLSGIIAGEYLTNKKPAPNINRFLLAQVNKDTGETEMIYDLGGGKDGILPAFSIDEIGSKFYLIKNRKIYCFSL